MIHLKRLEYVRYYESWVAVLVHDAVNVPLCVVVNCLIRLIHDVLDHLASSVIYTDLFKSDKQFALIISIIGNGKKGQGHLVYYFILLYLPNQIRFPIGGRRVTCHGSKLTNFQERTKLTNSQGKQRFELSTRT